METGSGKNKKNKKDKANKKIIINKNQLDLLNTIQSFRYIPIRALMKIVREKGIYRHLPSLSRVIKKLKNEGLVRSFLYGNNQSVVYITNKGAEILAFDTGRSIKEITIPNQGQKVQFATLEHTVRITDIYMDLMEEVKNHSDIELKQWIGDQNVFCKYEFRANKRGNKIRRTLTPDSYFELIKKREIKPFFLEYDTGTMDKTQLSWKFMRYFEYFIYGNWREKYEKFPNILFLTERSEKSLENLLVEPEESLEHALKNRQNFIKSNNLLWKSIGLAENIKSINSSKIREFLNLEFIFTQIKKSWEEQILKNL